MIGNVGVFARPPYPYASEYMVLLLTKPLTNWTLHSEVSGI